MIAIIACAALLAAQPDAADITIHVSPSGDDGTGTGAAEAPLATPERARDVLRERRTAPETRQCGGRIVFHAGTYYLQSTLRLEGQQDSGTDAHPVVYAAAPGEAVVFSGGWPVSDWKRSGDAMWATDARAADAGAPVLDLFMGGRRLTRARQPNTGWYRIDQHDDARTEFALGRGEYIPGEPGPRDNVPEAVARSKYVEPRQTLQAWESRAFRTSGRFGSELSNEELQPGVDVFFEGARAFLDAPYEWHYSPAGKFEVILPPGQDPQNAVIVAARLQTLVLVDRASYVRFEGIAFEHSARRDPRGGYDPQWGGMSGRHDATWAAALLPAAVRFVGTEHCSITGGLVAHTGAVGVWIESARNADGTWASARDNSVVGTRFDEIGAAAVVIGPSERPGDNPWPAEGEPARPDFWVFGTTVRDCRVQNFGRVYADNPAIILRIADRAVIDHNEIAFGGYAGIATGWSHENTKAFMHASRITGNSVHDVMRVLADGAGIYATGAHPGSLIEGNVVSRIERDPALRSQLPAAALYFDEGSEGWTVRGNVVRDAELPIFFNVRGSPAHPTDSKTSGRLEAWGANYFDQRFPFRAAWGDRTIPEGGALYFDAYGPPAQVRAIERDAGPTH